MLKSFSIANFRSFKDKTTLTLEARTSGADLKEAIFEHNGKSYLKCLALYGANASGKSNLVRAFFVFRQMVLTSLLNSISGQPFPVQPFLLNTKTGLSPSFFEIEVYWDGALFVYGFEINQKEVKREWLRQYATVKPRELFARNGKEITINQVHFKEAASHKDNLRENVLFLSLLASLNIEIAKKVVEAIKSIEIVDATQRGATMEFSMKKFTDNAEYRKLMLDFVIESDFGIIDIKSSERKASRDELLKKIPPQFAPLLPNQGGEFSERDIKAIHKVFDENQREAGTALFDFFTQTSTGTQQVFALAGPFVDVLLKGKTLVIDELDASLHPLMCRFFIKKFYSRETNYKNAQLIFTTHDISLLDSEILRRDQIWFAEKNKLAATELFSLANLSERKNVSFEKRYLEGRYGALPYIKTLEQIKE